MTYFVDITSATSETVYLYEGRSHNKSVEALNLAIALMKSVKGTGTLWHYNADSRGNCHFLNGEIR